MTAHVYVTLKKTVLDPQGQTVRSALTSLGYHSVADVRQGKYFEIQIAPGISADEARRELAALAAEVLTNPVIEEYRFDLKE